MAANIFVIGLDNFNKRKLSAIAEARGYEIHPLLDVTQVKGRGPLAVDTLISQALDTLHTFHGRVDAIVGYWDFPVTCLAAFLNGKMGLPAPSLESVLKCEHKYWCRVEQSKVIDEHPRFCAFNPFDPDPISAITLPYPFWIKPVKAFASQLGFKIHNAEEFHDSLRIIRQGIVRFKDPFTYFLKQVSLPPALAAVDGGWCIAEELISGRQCTLEGYVHDGRVEVYGVLDSIRESNRSSFSRYEYPSKLHKQIQDRMIAIAERVMTQFQYDHAPFNIELFFDEHHDKIRLLEINPRISQSHCDLFEKVDGASHHEVMIDLALGKRPDFPRRQGPYGCAGKFLIRTHEDAVLTRVPTDHDINRVKTLFPDTLVNIHVKEGMRPSDLPNQEPYSYEVGYLYMGAKNEHELLEHHRQAMEYLRFEASP